MIEYELSYHKHEDFEINGIEYINCTWRFNKRKHTCTSYNLVSITCNWGRFTINWREIKEANNFFNCDVFYPQDTICYTYKESQKYIIKNINKLKILYSLISER